MIILVVALVVVTITFIVYTVFIQGQDENEQG